MTKKTIKETISATVTKKVAAHWYKENEKAHYFFDTYLPEYLEANLSDKNEEYAFELFEETCERVLGLVVGSTPPFHTSTVPLTLFKKYE
jgi:hypothetical protein